jgi:eukaryotic-like serine/threonine-protein kinase
MFVCPVCSKDAPPGSRFCPSCGGALAEGSGGATRTSFPRAVAAPPVVSAPFDRGRFLPGTILVERYRIYGLLGRGGMGEVYRADDLRLGQIVALKFLPRSVERDESRRSRFLNEVKIARQVSHTNVCRVYDVGDVDGRHFISMEFVDGEDLAALLLRIGRLPRDKAVQIARQLCAGLAAAHEQGVLHRDLKPANVMIDGRGKARITDFGLAELAGAADGAGSTAGTPAYMAPEQLAGSAASVKSDLYALGLVLYELFTGQRPFLATDAQELVRLQQETEPATPSSHVEGFDPAVERVILRCLRKDPKERPSSALSVAAALPGGDPLAAALAAGETPSPELVAEAGEVGRLAPAAAWTCLSVLAVGVLSVVLLSATTQVTRIVPLPKSPEILAERARTLVQELAPGDPPVDTAFDFAADEKYLDYVAKHDPSPDRWRRLATGRPPAIFFWLRQGPTYLLPYDRYWLDSTFKDPPPNVPGMIGLVLDPRGRLERFERVPPAADDAATSVPTVDWSVFFREAALDESALKAAEPRWTPPVYADRRFAWEGSYPDDRNESIRVEAASDRGTPVFFRIVHPWTEPEGARNYPVSVLVRASNVALAGLMIGVLIGGALLARRNVRLGKGDRKGAVRLGAFILAAGWLAVLLNGHFVASFDMTGRVVGSLAFPLLVSMVVGVFYLALEPYVRRFWPRMIVSWVRLLDGRVRDPLVGRDALIGLLVGTAGRLLDQLFQLASARAGAGAVLFDRFAGPPLDVQLVGLRGMRSSLAAVAGFVVVPLLLTLAYLMVLLLCRIVLRKHWVAIAAFLVLVTLVGLPSDVDVVPLLVWSALWSLLYVIALFRFGFLPLVVGLVFRTMLLGFPMTTDPSAWYAGRTLLVIVVAGAVAAYGMRTALPSRPAAATGPAGD